MVSIDVTEGVDSLVDDGGSSNAGTVIGEKADNVTGGASTSLPSYFVVLVTLVLVKVLSFMF